jgi:hypothetical protein
VYAYPIAAGELAGTKECTVPVLVLVNKLVERWPSVEKIVVPVLVEVTSTSEVTNASPVLTALMRCDVNGFSTTLHRTVSYVRGCTNTHVLGGDDARERARQAIEARRVANNGDRDLRDDRI